MNKGQLQECVAFTIRCAREVTLKLNLSLDLTQNVTHYALDILHRFLANQSPLWVQDQDYYMLGLACFFIAAKLNSTHYGGADYIISYYYNERPRPPRSNKADVLPDSRDPKLRAVLESELFRIEFEILKTLNFQFTPLEDLSLSHIRRFMRQVIETGQASEKDYKQFELVATKFLLDFFATSHTDCPSPALLAACATQKAFLVLSKLKCFRSASKQKSGETTCTPPLLQVTLLEISPSFLPANWPQLYDIQIQMELIERTLEELIF